MPFSAHSPIGEPLSLLALENVTIKGHLQEKIKGNTSKVILSKSSSETEAGGWPKHCGDEG